MELLKGGHLKNLIDYRKKLNQALSDEDVSVIVKNLLKAIEYIHQNNIVHRDLKLGQFLIF